MSKLKVMNVYKLTKVHMKQLKKGDLFMMANGKSKFSQTYLKSGRKAIVFKCSGKSYPQEPKGNWGSESNLSKCLTEGGQMSLSQDIDYCLEYYVSQGSMKTAIMEKLRERDERLINEFAGLADSEFKTKHETRYRMDISHEDIVKIVKGEK